MLSDDKAEERRLLTLQIIKDFCLFDDDFMTMCFENSPECVELVLRIILDKPDLQVTESQTQVFIANLLQRSVRLDVLATDSAGRKYNIEIQREDKGAGKRRARYNSSMLDARLTAKGLDFEDLPETYVIFITENDVFGKGLPIYPVERYISVTGERFDDGTHIIYANGKYQDDTPVGRLMHDFACSNPGDMHYKLLADKARYFKEEKEGVGIMSRTMDRLLDKILNEYKEEGLKEGIRAGKEVGREEGIRAGRQLGIDETKRNLARRMLTDKDLSLEKIAAYSGLTLEEVKKLQNDKSA